MSNYPREKAASEFLAMTDDISVKVSVKKMERSDDPCLDKWMSTQEVYCQLPKDHSGMHESDAESDLGENVHLWWGKETDNDLL